MAFSNDSNKQQSAPGYAGGRRDMLLETRPKGDTAATVAIASISDQDWYVSRTHGVYHIPACRQRRALRPAFAYFTRRCDRSWR